MRSGCGRPWISVSMYSIVAQDSSPMCALSLLAKTPAIMQDFVLKEKQEAKTVSRMAAVCPVCGKMAKINGLCPGCGFDMLMSRDAREVSMHKQILSLSEEDRQRFREEYHTEIERQVSMGLDATIRNPALREEFLSRLSAICRKYGITA